MPGPTVLPSRAVQASTTFELDDLGNSTYLTAVCQEDMGSWVQHQEDQSCLVIIGRQKPRILPEISMDQLWPSLALSRGQVIRNQPFSHGLCKGPDSLTPKTESYICTAHRGAVDTWINKPNGDWIPPHFSLGWNTLGEETVCTTLGHGPDAGTFTLLRTHLCVCLWPPSPRPLVATSTLHSTFRLLPALPRSTAGDLAPSSPFHRSLGRHLLSASWRTRRGGGIQSTAKGQGTRGANGVNPSLRPRVREPRGPVSVGVKDRHPSSRRG
ncbi:hypothetical protein Cadr_000023977 [Camelus dromedarius]|uniref:Uncharacterized protein n=1 Tax=Camelus dromedarius TaxID=9838 RepID=A0A5N4CWI7_CAMDR|nr:hypothetical protein Cadr_000023977 [Camelus dromedarius]